VKISVQFAGANIEPFFLTTKHFVHFLEIAESTGKCKQTPPSPHQVRTKAAPSSLPVFAFFVANTQVVFTPGPQNPVFFSLP